MIFQFNELNNFIAALPDSKIVKKRGKQYYNIAASFDIETSSFYFIPDEHTNITNEDYKKRLIKNPKLKGEKRAIMYIWQLAIEDNIIIGRTWAQFIEVNAALRSRYQLNDDRKLIIYVHNLAYECQFIRKLFKWRDIFATEERRPLSMENEYNIIFKCSLRLSGYSLKVVANNLHDEKIEKLTGDLDYSLIRNSKTPLTDKELEYCYNDVKIVVAFIRENIKEYKKICDIPLTQTGIVRRYVRKLCFKNPKYRFLIKDLTVDNIEYLLLNRAFAGGFTHAGALHSTQVCNNVTSFDFTSSYPTVLCSESFPMSKGRLIPNDLLNIDTFNKLLNKYCCLFNVIFYNIESSFIYDNIISRSKCYICENAITNNGRVVKASKLAISVTDIDFKCIRDFYKWDSFQVSNFYVYNRGFLPREIVESVLDLYSDKTTLKGVAGKEVEYMHKKQMLNSIYGMCVTSIVRDSIEYNNNEWSKTGANVSAEIDNYNNDKYRFLFYHWGVWCTAYARRNLYSGLLECKEDYIYSDTDSIKIFNADKHKKYFDSYNETIIKKLEYVCNYHKIDVSKIKPKTIKGVEKPLGVWDFDGHYKKFKTLGAKRYLILNDDNTFSLTVAGLNKKVALPFLLEDNESIDDVFNTFNDGLFIPDEKTGKNTHTYIDNETAGVVTDYLGNTASYKELSSVHLENAPYLLSLTDSYIEYLLGVRMAYSDIL